MSTIAPRGYVLLDDAPWIFDWKKCVFPRLTTREATSFKTMLWKWISLAGRSVSPRSTTREVALEEVRLPKIDHPRGRARLMLDGGPHHHGTTPGALGADGPRVEAGANGNEQELPALAGYAREGARHTDGIRAWDSIWLGGGQ